ncbi:MAG: hypothetical protein A2Y07_01515 [Planctomycetes bacterium GWF2_50_10]|nr:MAG: hypothetical protein A2Y07_01515 [Planctomycetes bacterium GWF2_50_10]
MTPQMRICIFRTCGTHIYYGQKRSWQEILKKNQKGIALNDYAVPENFIKTTQKGASPKAGEWQKFQVNAL